MGYAVHREELGRLEQDWRRLAAHSGPACVFLSPTWLRTWWEVFGGGRDLFLLSVRQGGDLVGVAPLMRQGDRLSFAGDPEICDYMDFSIAPGAEGPVLTAVLRSLGEEPWQELALWGLLETSPTLRALPRVCADLGLHLRTELQDVAPYVDLPTTWEEYLARLSKKDRHELRRKLRRLGKGGDVGLEVLERPAEVAGAMDDFLDLHRASRAEKAAFLTEPVACFFRKVAVALAEEGRALLLFLTLNGVRAAGLLCFRGEGELLLYNSGYERGYSSLAVGLLSKALALQWAIQAGVRRFDFLRGAEPYKYDLGARNREILQCSIRRT